jgi:hypothetical protein
MMKLFFCSIELNKTIEEQSTKSIKSIPKTLVEINHTKKEINVLKEKIDNFNKSLTSIEDSSENSISYLSQFDVLKNKLERCNSSLEQAETFSMMMKEIEEGLNQSEFERTSNLIQKVQQSFDILKSLNKFKNDGKKLDQYKEKFEEIIRPNLIESTKNYDSANLKSFLIFFQKIGRENSFHSSYFEIRFFPINHIINKKDADLPTILEQFYNRYFFFFKNEISKIKIFFLIFQVWDVSNFYLFIIYFISIIIFLFIFLFFFFFKNILIFYFFYSLKFFIFQI